MQLRIGISSPLKMDTVCVYLETLVLLGVAQ